MHTATEVCAILSHVFQGHGSYVIFSAMMTTLDGEETGQQPTILCCQSLVPAKKIGEE
jgi:hypothetical protein